VIGYGRIMRDTVQPAPPEGGTTWRTVTLVVMAVLGAATLVALIVILSGANRQRDRALEAQAHSFQVMVLSRTLSGTMARSEASLGRYVISGDRTLGQLYFDQWRLASSQIERLDRTTRDSPEQRARIERLRAAFDARGRELSLIALSTNYGKNAQAYARLYQARETPTLAAIDTALSEIINRERSLLDRRTTAALATVDRASRVAGVLAVFGILLVLGAIALGWVTVQAMGERATARADADAAQARAEELTAAVADATGELRLQEAKLRQVQKMEAVGQLTGGIAHDFNNMLAVVLGGLELAKRHLGSNPAAVRRNLDSATEGANRAAALTRRLLAFSREESLKPEPIVAAQLVTGMSDLLDRTLGDAITLKVEDRSDGWRVLADRVQLENAVLNLAVNARDAMAGRGVLTVATGTRRLGEHEIDHCRGGEYVTLAVTDTGHGMTPDIAERVFEPFFTTKEAGKGTGLGLSQIFGLVRQLGGEIAIDTAPGRGTTVTLYLLREDAPALVAAQAEATPAAARPMEGLTILVVEDDPRVLAATTGALEELGHRPLACADPLAAPALLDANPGIDLVVSDVLMPRQTGPEMVAGLIEHHPALAVLFVTGFAGEVNAAEFDGRPVLRKPFTLAALERAVVDAVAAAPPVASRQAAAA
jgi:signal transduction histidine kinase/CheY-like chemotaxis protein